MAIETATGKQILVAALLMATVTGTVFVGADKYNTHRAYANAAPITMMKTSSAILAQVETSQAAFFEGVKDAYVSAHPTEKVVDILMGEGAKVSYPDYYDAGYAYQETNQLDKQAIKEAYEESLDVTMDLRFASIKTREHLLSVATFSEDSFENTHHADGVVGAVLTKAFTDRISDTYEIDARFLDRLETFSTLEDPAQNAVLNDFRVQAKSMVDQVVKGNDKVVAELANDMNAIPADKLVHMTIRKKFGRTMDYASQTTPTDIAPIETAKMSANPMLLRMISAKKAEPGEISSPDSLERARQAALSNHEANKIAESMIQEAAQRKDQDFDWEP